MLKIDFLGYHGNGQVEKKKGVHFSSSFDIRKKYTKFQTILTLCFQSPNLQREIIQQIK